MSTADSAAAIEAVSLIDELGKDFLSGSLKLHEDRLAEDVILLGAGDPRILRGKDSYLSYLRTASEKAWFRRMDIKSEAVKLIGDLAVLVGTYSTESQVKGKDYLEYGRQTALLVRRHGRWFLVLVHMETLARNPVQKDKPATRAWIARGPRELSAVVGAVVSHYRVLRKLGGGGMGVVYEAEDTQLGRRVALKFLPPELTSDGHARARFIQEAQAASALDHPHIATVHELGEHEGELFIVMAFYPGETLKARLARERVVGVRNSCGIAAQIAAGLAEAHEHGIIHRDIKPANVMITEDGIAKILDFGLAKLARSDEREATAHAWGGSGGGTVAYMAPEQISGRLVGPSADLWALGLVLYEMLAGSNPFERPSIPETLNAVAHEEPEPLESRRQEVHPQLAWIVSRCLVKDAKTRRQSARDLVQDLEHFAGPNW